MSAAGSQKKGEEGEKVVAGELLYFGGTNWEAMGRKGSPADGILVSPTRLKPLVGINIRFVASGCSEDPFFFNFSFLFDCNL